MTNPLQNEAQDLGQTEQTDLSEQARDLSPQAMREEVILAFWDKEHIFEQTLKKESPKGDFVFYDGPPYATGTPHFGHLLPSTIKDALPRFKTMQGYHVPRRWGWDCHGLPIENLIEKELNLPDKKAIIEYGIDKFNKAARASVFRYDAEWQKVIHRMGRFVDMKNAYHTMDPSYTESVWSSFKRLHEKGLVYEGHRVMQICPRCETTLSNFEVGQGYKDIQDISVYVLFELKNEPNTYFLAWTTTPWTLHGNAALAVNPEKMYEKILIKEGEHKDKKIILMRNHKEILKGEVGKDWETVEKIQGKDLVGLAYNPIFTVPFTQKEIATLDDSEKSAEIMSKAWHVYGAEFVTADDGTGIVHIAPGYGDDDYKLGSTNNLPVILHVGINGLASPALGEPFAGKAVKVKGDHQGYDIEVIKTLAHAGKLFAKEKITHSYPHCWRCDTPLLNLATSAWFVEVTKLQSKFIEQNNTVKWIPESVGSGRFGTWLENVRDWNISRARFWGAPLPIWRGVETGKITVLGTIDELKSYIPKRNTYTLIRHGQAESNLTGVVNSSDLSINGLTELGRQQVREAALQLKDKKKITKIYASDFRRTKETAVIVAEILGIDQTDIIFDRRLREFRPGAEEGSNWMEHWAKYDSQYQKMFEVLLDADGECVADVKKRATEFLYEIDAVLEGEEVLIVTHGLPLRLMKYTAEGKTARDLVRTGWSDISDENASQHDLDWRKLPHNETLELDIHRPYIDHVTWVDPETGEAMVRVSDVFDVWYDSGSMPFAQNNFLPSTVPMGEIQPRSQFPADFIAEGLDQTRGWFYSLLALGVGLFDTVPYKHVMVNGLILAEDGRKMSKSLKNYPPLGPTIDKYGVDSLRYFLAASPATHAEGVAFSEKGLDEVNKKIFNRLDNMYAFLDMYTSHELEGSDAWTIAKGKLGDEQISLYLAKLSHPLDIWAIARLNQTIQAVTEGFEGYLIDKATRPIGELIDDMSRLYLKRSRDRFKGEGRLDAIFVTRFVLERLSKLMAPVTPFMAEYLYTKVKFGHMLSVHLDSWPTMHLLQTQNQETAIEHDLMCTELMKSVDQIIEKGLALRADAKIKVRQVLQSFTFDKSLLSQNWEGDFTVAPEVQDALKDLIKDEINVKELIIGDAFALDTHITPELKIEGFVRETIRAIQQQRGDLKLQPQDKIKVTFVSRISEGTGQVAKLREVLKEHESQIKKITSADEVNHEDIQEQEQDHTGDQTEWFYLPYEDVSIRFKIEKIA